ncbi:MAG: hypothetical protein Q7S88_01820, partial [Candidatus Daviesbacteria bacterium]|nr:hypothetical protein [Candidatus Daviesbacteria bacterium]
AIAKVLAEDLANNNIEHPETLPLDMTSGSPAISTNGVAHAGQLSILSPSNQKAKVADLCPECGNAALVFEEGCKKCYSCGYSAC